MHATTTVHDFGHCKDARVCDHTTTAIRDDSPPRPSLALPPGLEREPGSVELRKNLFEAQKQHHASQASASRAARPRETLKEYVRGHVSLTAQFALRAFLLACWVRLGEGRGGEGRGVCGCLWRSELRALYVLCTRCMILCARALCLLCDCGCSATCADLFCCVASRCACADMLHWALCAFGCAVCCACTYCVCRRRSHPTLSHP